MLKYGILALLFPVLASAYQDPAMNGFATYSSSARVVPQSTVTEGICVLGGSSTKTIRVNQIYLATTQTTAGTNAWRILKKSNVFPVYTNQGDTMIRVPLDLRTVSSTASSITLFSNATTSGVTLGAIKTFFLFSPAPATASAGVTTVWDFDRDGSGQPIVLRGTKDTVELNLGLTTLPAGLVATCGFAWSEE